MLIHKNNLKIIVCGGRDFDDYAYLHKILHYIHINYHIAEIINGSAKGADKLSTTFAVAYSIPFRLFPANWDRYGRQAGYFRNIQMSNENPDLVVAFPGGRGTQMMIDISKEKGIPVLDTTKEDSIERLNARAENDIHAYVNSKRNYNVDSF